MNEVWYAPAVILGILAAAGAVQGAAGFGYGIIAVGLLGRFLPDLRTAVALPILANIALTGTILFRLRGEVRLRKIAVPLAASLLFIFPGTLFLASARPGILSVGIGLLLIVSAAYSLHPGLKNRPWHPVYTGFPLGAVAGFLSGAFNSGGPAIIAFLSTQQLPHLNYVATLQLFFLSNALVRLISLHRLGLFTSDIALISGMGVAAAVAGSALGMTVLRRAPEKTLKRSVIAIQFLLGASYLIG